MNRIICSALVLAVAGCRAGVNVPPAPAAASAAIGAAADTAVPANVRWYRTSAEQRAIYLQTYRAAGASITRRAFGLQPQTWAVVLDADETVLDNSPYELDAARRHAPFDEASWDMWVLRGQAQALPGAVEFTRKVHSMGGRVVIVTNRTDAQCEPTRLNLSRAGVAAAQVLCRTTTGDKNPRFDAIAAGTAPSRLPPLNILMWVGDNIQDFPHLTQAVRAQPDSAFAKFGEEYIILPNPMYGSWEKNPIP